MAVEILATANVAPNWAIGVAKETRRNMYNRKVVVYYAVRICKDATDMGLTGGRFLPITKEYDTEAEARKAANVEYRLDREAVRMKNTA